MSHWLKTCAIALFPAMALTGCVDDNYDLSDVDTTSRIPVDNLVIPINIDEITMSDIIDIDDDSKIKIVTVDGKEFYALSETGSFNSDAIHVNKIMAQAPVLAPTSKTLTSILAGSGAQKKATSLDGINKYEIVDMGNSFDYHTENVDEAIVQLKSVKIAPVDFQIHLTTKNMEDVANSILFTDLVILAPKGMTATPSEGTYDPATGFWTIKSYNVPGTESDIYLNVSAIDMEANGATITADRRFKFAGDFRVRSGLLTIEAKKDLSGIPMQLPSSLEFEASYTLGDLDITSFSGVIEYNLEGMNVDPVNISDIPDFLDNPETDLLLANPQLYLQLNNPIAGNKLSYQTGIELQAIRDDAPALDFAPASLINVGFDKGVTGPYNIVLAPSQESLSTPADFKDNLSFVSFPTMGGLLGSADNSTVKGLPKQIGISIVSPQIPRQTVTDFALGTDITGVNGKYELLAPLALSDKSVIVYSSTEDGWGSEDLDAVTINKLSATLNVTNSTPLDATLVAYPIDRNGKRIPGVEVTAKGIKGNTTNQPVTIEMTGVIRNLDGVIFEATVRSASGQTLAPSETITLHNVRACVSGWYEKEL